MNTYYSANLYATTFFLLIFSLLTIRDNKITKNVSQKYLVTLITLFIYTKFSYVILKKTQHQYFKKRNRIIFLHICGLPAFR